MAVRITNLIKGFVTLGDPVNDTLVGEEIKNYPFVEYDKLINDDRFTRLVNERIISIESLDPTALPLYDSPWNGPTRFRLGTYQLWVDSLGFLRIKNGDALFDFDGATVGGGAANVEQIIIQGLTTAAMSQYLAGYVSANNVVSPTNCSGTGTTITATFAGVYNGVAGQIINRGKAEVLFNAALTPVPGDDAFLSYTTNGYFTNVAPTAGSGVWRTEAGVILDASTYGATQRCTILLQPNEPVYRP